MNQRLFLLFLCCSWSGAFTLTAQEHATEIAEYRKNYLRQVTSGSDSPLWPEDTAGISYFDADARYLVNAKVELLKGEKPFRMPTYAGTAKEFIRHARLHFEIGGAGHTLTAYRDLSIPPPAAAFFSALFIPFKDETNGETTYGGGRYLELPVRKGAEEVSLDFNKAYNPYCAYSDGYRCPVPPGENHLAVPVPAGEKAYTGAKRERGVRPAGP